MLSILEKAVLASRHLLIVFFLGLGVALLAYAVGFLVKLYDFATHVLDREATEQLIGLLYLLDAALVASLVVMVAISSWDSLVSPLAHGAEDRAASWIAKLDPGNLKLKLATALVAISSIHLLQIFMEVGQYSDRAVEWSLALHGMFLGGALVLGLVDRMTGSSKPATKL